MIWLLVIATLLFLVVNYILGSYDYTYPPFLFSFVFFISSFVCGLGSDYYSISISVETVLAIVLGLIVFTITVPLFKRHSCNHTREISYINIGETTCFLFIILQIISIYFFVRYLNSIMEKYISAGYTHLVGSTISDKIKLYDTLTKFWTSIFSSLSVPIPMAYRILNPVCGAIEYMLLYIGINNYLIKKRINISYVLIYILMIIRILLNGSRSPVLRIVTFAMIIFYVLQYRRGKIKKGSFKILGKILIIGLCLIVFMFLSLFVMGRVTGDMSFANELFVYIGAPIANLNIFIDRYCPKILVGVSDGLFGAHTFSKLYRYMGKLLSININISSIFKFEFSGGHEIGNVYTMFASPLFDFGYIGVVFVVLIMGIYYGCAYNYIMCSKKNKGFDYRLFIYAYLINDLIMSFFSNRFFETVCDAPFIKFFIVSFFIYFCFYSKKIYFPRVYIKVHRNKRR